MPTLITQDEVDTLLASLEVADKHRRPHCAGGGATAALYDFRYAAKLSPDHLRVLQARVVSLASVLNRTMSLYLNNVVEFHVHSVDVASYEQYIRNLAVNPILGVITFGPSAPPALWEMSSALAYTAMDCMLGGTGTMEVEAGREVTPLERAVLRRLLEEILTAWTELWDRLATLRPRVEEVVSSPGSVDLRAVDERLFCVVLEVTIARTKGMLRLCIPLGAVKRLLRDEKEAVSPVDLDENGEEPPAAGALVETPLVLTAQYNPPDMPLSALLRLQPGEVLDLRLPASEPVSVSLSGVRKFHGQSGIAGGKIAVQLL